MAKKVNQNISGYISAANNSADLLTSILNSLMCLPSTLGEFLNPVKISKSISAGSTQITQSIKSIVGGLVQSRIAAITGQIRSVVPATLVPAKTPLRQKASSAVDFMRNQENCAHSGSELLACLMQNIQNQVTGRLSTSTVANLDPFINKLTDQLGGDGGVFSNYGSRNIDQVKYYQDVETLTRRFVSG